MSELSKISELRPLIRTVQRCAPDRKLYLPYSSLCVHGGKIAPILSGAYPVNIHWFIAGRSEPISPYQTLIQRYSFLPSARRARAETMVDEFFCEDEFRLLEKYMQTRHRNLRISMQVAPVESNKPDDMTRVGGLRPFTNDTDAKKADMTILRMSDEEGYTLPFTVWGAYITRHVVTNPIHGMVRTIVRSVDPDVSP